MKKTIALICFCLPLLMHAQYQIASNMAMGKKTTITTVPAQGYVIKNDGTKLEGEIKLKVVNNDTTEVTLRSFSGSKITFARLDLLSFGLKGGGGGGTGKTGDLLPGYAVFTDGNKVEGQVAFSSGYNYGDFKKHIWGFYLKTSDTSEPKYYGPEDGVDYVTQMEKSGEKKYAPVENVFVDYDELLDALNDPKAKDKANNLQSGYVSFKDGRKVEGRLARQKGSKFVFVGADSKLNNYYAKDESIAYIIQRIDGVEKKFISLMSNMKAFSGEASEWVEVFQPSGLYSYYQNPAPTHKKEGVTNLVKGSINTTTALVANEAGKEAGEQQLKQDLKEDKKNLYQMAGDAQATRDKTTQDVQSAVSVGDEGGIYFDEWIIVNNATGEKTVIYKKNDEEMSGNLLKKCSASASLDKGEWKKLTHVDNVGLLVTYLNANKCN